MSRRRRGSLFALGLGGGFGLDANRVTPGWFGLFSRLAGCALLGVLLLPSSVRAIGADVRWWPTQREPKGIVRVLDQFPEPSAAHAMLAQSVAGLAAKAVNEGRGDEMVWLVLDNADVEDWLSRRLQRRPQIERRGTSTVWNLVDRYAVQGIIKGYILYRWDRSKGDFNEHRPGMDCSVNVATSLAGLTDAVIIEESLEAEAKRHGLKRLWDVRGKTQAWCFGTFKDRFTRRMICTQDPRKPNVRDLAIAQKCLTVFGPEAPLPAIMAWLDPLSPVLGSNGGDEFETTRLSTVEGHFQTATDWAMNLPILMAGSENVALRPVHGFDPRTIDWHDRRGGVSFIDSDGDNVDRSEGSFFRGPAGRYDWANPERGKIPFGWSCCFAHLAQLVPEAIDYAAETQGANDTFLEWGGGYYYPDLFAANRAQRWELLARQAQRTWTYMRATGTSVVGFNVAKFDSADARRAYAVFAAQTDGLLAILVWQYDRYEAGAGQTFWVKDKNGLDVPVLSARYSLWHHTNDLPRSGTPAKVAREIAESVPRSSASGLPRYDWVNAHAWSWFRRVPGADESAEEMPQQNAASNGGQRGYAPAWWCAERLDAKVRVMSPEEMIWRIRMQHDAAQTKRAIERWDRDWRR